MSLLSRSRFDFKLSPEIGIISQVVEQKDGLGQVQAVESRIVLVFRLKNMEDLARYHEGHISPLTPICKRGGTDCDFGSQEKLYASNVEVQPIIWKTYDANRKLKIQKR